MSTEGIENLLILMRQLSEPPKDKDGFYIPATDADGFLVEALSWESQVVQYPEVGEPGIGYHRGDMSESYGEDAHVDSLLYRDEAGAVVGILNYYPREFKPWEREGGVNVFVHPEHRREGIATALVTEALTRWRIDPAAQRFTRAGRAMGEKFIVLKLRIENTYEDGEEIIDTPTIALPLDPDTWDDHVRGWTGTGRTDGDAWYDVEVTESSHPDLIPVGKRWEYGY